jgi:hypothetical protein
VLVPADDQVFRIMVDSSQAAGAVPHPPAEDTFW